MRLIDADALPRHKQLEAFGNGQYEDVEIVYGNDIDNASTIEAEPVKHGWWVRDGIDKWRCSVCGVGDNYAYAWSVGGAKLQDNYCPNCGAKMEGRTDEK